MQSVYPENKPYRVAAYGRVSTDHEDQLDALENQIQWYKEFVSARPAWTFVDLYVDEGVTGTSAKKRKGFTKMIADAEAGLFDCIITREASRWARNIVDALSYTRKLKSIGVSTYFINDNIFIDSKTASDDELRLSIMSILAQDESRKTSIRVKAGQAISMQNGVFYGTGNILGYDRDGRNMIVNPEQAETVKMIFDMYLSNMSLRDIKYELEKRNRKTSTGLSKWHAETIGHVLKNTFYYGDITYHKEYIPDFLNQDIRKKNKGEIEQIIVKGTHEPIITKECFEKVQKIMASRTRGDKRGGVKKSNNFWTKKLICGECGHKLGRITWNRKEDKVEYGYQCYQKSRHGSLKTRLKHGVDPEGACNSQCVPEWKLNLMADYLFSHILIGSDEFNEEVENYANILSSMIENRQPLEDITKESENKTIEKIEKEKNQLEKLQKRLENLAYMKADGEISGDMFQKMNKETSTLIAEREKQINTLQKSLQEIKKPVIKTKNNITSDFTSVISSIRKSLNNINIYDRDGNIIYDVIDVFVECVEVFEDRFIWRLSTNQKHEFKKNLPQIDQSGTGRYRQPEEIKFL